MNEVPRDTNKYKLTGDTIVHDNVVLHRIRALRSFGDIKAGALGGFVECEDNLSHERHAWIADNAKAHSQMRVMEDALLKDNAEARGKGSIFGNAIMEQNAFVDASIVYGSARVRGRAELIETSSVSENAIVQGNAVLSSVSVTGNAIISGDTLITRNISGDARIGGRNEDKMPHESTDIFGLKTMHELHYMEMRAIIERHDGVMIEDAHQQALSDAYPNHYVFRALFPVERADEARIALRRQGFVLAIRELFRLDSSIETQINVSEPKKKVKAAKKPKAAKPELVDVVVANAPKSALLVRYAPENAEIAATIVKMAAEFGVTTSAPKPIKTGTQKGLTAITASGDAKALRLLKKNLTTSNPTDIFIADPVKAGKSKKKAVKKPSKTNVAKTKS